jgi:3-dehydroquinate synthase
VHDYHVRFVEDGLSSLAEYTGPNDIVLIDEKVGSLYESRLAPLLEHQAHVPLTASEEQKSYLQLAPVITALIEKNFRKNNRLVVIGGGIIQDIGAFLAANLYRGVQWIFFPTTLLAQCDSCIGGKSSINFGTYKNQLGNFYPPNDIIIDPGLLATLPPLDVRSGLGEMIHFFLISGPDDFKRIMAEYDHALTDRSTLQGLIHRSLKIKKAVIEIDEFDQNQRLLFNYGHSFGHAIETLTGYRIPHGIAVSYGMDLANYLSMQLGYISQDLYKEIHVLLHKNWADIELGRIDTDAFISALKKDKKNIDSQVVVILTKGIGRMFKTALPIDVQTVHWMEQYFEETGP